MLYGISVSTWNTSFIFYILHQCTLPLYYSGMQSSCNELKYGGTMAMLSTTDIMTHHSVSHWKLYLPVLHNHRKRHMFNKVCMNCVVTKSSILHYHSYTHSKAVLKSGFKSCTVTPKVVWCTFVRAPFIMILQDSWLVWWMVRWVRIYHCTNYVSQNIHTSTPA